MISFFVGLSVGFIAGVIATFFYIGFKVMGGWR